MIEAFGYKWTRTTTGEYYYGIHKGTIDDGYVGSGILFQKKYKNTPKEEWQREILFYGYYDACLKWETQTVTEDLINNDPLCLNRQVGGVGGTHSDYSKKLLSNTLIEMWQDEEYRKRMSDAHKGYIPTKEQREKLSKAHSGTNSARFKGWIINSKGERFDGPKSLLEKGYHSSNVYKCIKGTLPNYKGCTWWREYED